MSLDGQRAHARERDEQARLRVRREALAVVVAQNRTGPDAVVSAPSVTVGPPYWAALVR